jgi:hypothetical protein
MFSVHNYYGGIDPIHMGSKGEEDIVKRDKEYLENVEKISKYFNGCILQEEQEVKNEEDPNPIHKIELDKDTTISFRLINPDLSSEEGLEEIGKAKEFFRKLLGSYYSTYTSEDPEPFSAPSGSDFDVDKESIKKEEKIQEQIRKEENEKENKLLSILDRIATSF